MLVLSPERLKYYTESLSQQLQRFVTSLRSYQALKAEKTPVLLAQATRLWELNQRYYLAKGNNEAAAVSLLSACQEAYQALKDNILNLLEELDKIADKVSEFQRECLQLASEQVSNEIPGSLHGFIGFLEESLKTYENQAKFMELHMLQLHPKYALGESALKTFKLDLQLPEYVENKIAFGLATAEQLLPYPLTLSMLNVL